MTHFSILLKSRIWVIVRKLTNPIWRTNVARVRLSKRTLSMLIIIFGTSCVLTSLLFGSLFVHERSGFLGYYGAGDGSHTYVRVTENIDLKTVLTQAQASGCNVTYRCAYQGMWGTQRTPHSSRIYSGVSMGTRYIGITYYVGMNETFDYAFPTFASINCPSTASEEWIKLRLQEFFPQLTQEESSDFAARLTSSYDGIDISGSPMWEIISDHLGTFSSVSCVPIGSIYKSYSNGMIEYELPSVTISKEITLIWNRSVVFIVSANGLGFVQVSVNSKYMLDTNWIRGVLAKMFLDIGLPADAITKYSIYENWTLDWDR